MTFDLFSLAINHSKTHTDIDMLVTTHTVNTRDLPDTYDILSRSLPSVLRSECFNDQRVPFSIEVRTTEVGHLFEHILLEHLCLQKMATGCRSATYSGVTNWNWKKDTWGMFHIMVSAGYKDLSIFPLALEKSVNLLRAILQTSQHANYLPYQINGLFVLPHS